MLFIFTFAAQNMRIKIIENSVGTGKKAAGRSGKIVTEGRIDSLRRGTSYNFISSNIRNHAIKTYKAIFYLYP